MQGRGWTNPQQQLKLWDIKIPLSPTAPNAVPPCCEEGGVGFRLRFVTSPPSAERLPMADQGPGAASTGGQPPHAASQLSRREEDMAALAKPANDRIFTAYHTPKAAMEREVAWASVSQWRCMPRLQDFAAATLQWYSLAEKRKRAALLLACARSAPGEEPLLPYLTDPRQTRITAYSEEEAAAPAPGGGARQG